MGKSKYRVQLTTEQHSSLEALLHHGTSAASTIRHAYILLHADKADTDIAASVRGHPLSVFNVRKTFVTQGLDAALHRKLRDAPPPAKIGRRLRSPPYPDRLQQTAGWPYPVDPAVARRSSREAEGCRDRLDQDRRAYAKKTRSSRIPNSSGSFLRTRTEPSSPRWRTCWTSTSDPLIPHTPSSAWMNSRSNCMPRCGDRFRHSPAARNGTTLSTRETGLSAVHVHRTAGGVAADHHLGNPNEEGLGSPGTPPSRRGLS